MKFKLFLFVLLFISIKSISQTFLFDKQIEYKSDFNGNINLYLFNTKDNNYYFHASSFDNIKINGYLIDNKRNKIHSFEIVTIPNKIEFKYIETVEKKEGKNQTFTAYYFDKNEIMIDRNTTEITINAYNSKRMKKKNKTFTLTINVENEDLILTEDFLDNFTHGAFSNSDYKFSFIIPSRISIDNKNLNIITSEMITNKKINLELIVK